MSCTALAENLHEELTSKTRQERSNWTKVSEIKAMEEKVLDFFVKVHVTNRFKARESDVVKHFDKQVKVVRKTVTN